LDVQSIDGGISLNIINGILSNKAVIIPALAWLIAQTIKVVGVIVRDKRVDFTRFVGSGGMPSSHSSFMVSLATIIAKNRGLESAEFAISVAVAMIVMYDAAGIRRAAGKQAEVLNKLIYSHDDKDLFDENLKELLGHTPFEVIMGAALGLTLGIWLG
jgi:hypothetical protein